MTHPSTGGEEATVDDLLAWIADLAADPYEPIDGISISGGEPLEQAEAVIDLCRGAQRLGLSVLVWTGHPWETVCQAPWSDALMQAVDLLIAGPYDAKRRIARGLRGSDNKTFHQGAGRRIALEELDEIPPLEVVISLDAATATWTGIGAAERKRRSIQ